MDWTDEQKSAINHKNGSAIVSAAAGSGKTAVLVQHVVTLLTDEENQIGADEIVVATFTEKAAGELKARLNAALSRAMEEKPSEYLKAQLLKLEDAGISTISSFCIRLLRNNSAAAELPPDFTILDEAEGGVMMKRAMDTVLEDFYDNAPEADKNLIYDWYGGENDNSLCEAIKYLCDFIKKLPNMEKDIEKWRDVYNNPALYADEYFIRFREAFLPPYLYELNENLPMDASMADEKSAPVFVRWQELISALSDFIENGKITDTAELTMAALPTVPRKTAAYDNAYVKAVNDKLKKIWGKMTAAFEVMRDFESDMEKCAPVFGLLIDLTLSVDREFTRLKRQKSKIDFADAEILALKLLRDEKIAAELRKNVSVIIVDEFQDSNDMQYEIFRTLSRNGENLYFVGDIKQSIYRFRGANPRVFGKILDNPDFENIYLNKNFRSSEKIIDSVNALFEKTMTKALGEVDYDENARLILGADYVTSEENQTELVRIYGKNMKDAREREAAYVADRIREMVESGFPVKLDDHNQRPCTYGDFAVLMGKYRTNAHIYKKALSKAGIPFEAKEDGAFTDFFEVKLMLSLLRIIDNPYYNKDMAAVLSVPPYSFTADELASAKISGGIEHKSLYTAVTAFARTNEKAKRFVEAFSELREFSAEHSVEQLVRKIYDESDIVTSILAMPDGDKRSANLKLLTAYARQFSEGGAKGLYDFISYMETISRSDIRLTQAKSSADEGNSVKIMTIHGSKGLEFPICIVANLSSSKKKGFCGGVIADIDSGIGMQAVYHKERLKKSTFLFEYIKQLNYNQELSEEMRLLYVAATRAKEKLIFTSPIKNDKYDVHLKWVYESRGVFKGLISDTKLLDYQPREYEKTEGETAEIKAIKPFSEYRYKEYTKIPAKVTATQVGVKSVNDFAETVSRVDRFLKTPAFIKEGEPKKLTGKKRGDAYHKAMELLDFSGDITQLDSLYRKGALTEAEFNGINRDEIEEFLKSPLCGRVNASEKVYKEYPIFCEYAPEDYPDDMEKPFVQGIADLFFIEDGEIVLVDYKTNTGVTEDMLREEYIGQLTVYSEALEKITGIKVKERYLYSFTLNKAVIL